MADQSGFTLLEVLVALLIFAISATALMSGMSQVLHQQERLEEKTFGNWIAENRVNEILIMNEFPKAGEKKEDLDYAGRHWQIKEAIINTPNPLMRRVEVSVNVYMSDNINVKPVTTVTSFIGAP
ncbi:type II secretion system protein GspI [Hahella sp. CCB-MM4]|nr:type II secretion system protein GspI [Hahella sp. CCB-MM4]